jgi:hypothetical protein
MTESRRSRVSRAAQRSSEPGSRTTRTESRRSLREGMPPADRRAAQWWAVALLCGVSLAAAPLRAEDTPGPERGAVLQSPRSAPVATDEPRARWTVAQAETAVAGVAGVTETRWQEVRAPGGASDRIQVHRYRGTSRPTAAVLYLPGTHMNGELAARDDDHSLWVFLARRGVDVYALDYRTHFVSATTPPAELSHMADWTLEAFAGDVQSAAELVRAEVPEIPLFVAGFSRGVTFAYALASGPAAPELRGLIALDGSFKDPAPGATPEAYDAAAARAQLVAAQRFAIDVGGRTGYDMRARLMRAAMEDPSGRPIGSDGSGNDEFATVGAQVARKLYDSWGPGALAHPIGVPGAGVPGTGGAEIGGAGTGDGSAPDRGVSRVDVLARLLLGYDRYYPTTQTLEARALAAQPDAPHTSLDDGWGELSLPILYFGSERTGESALGSGRHSAEASGSADVTVRVLAEHGHLDVLVSEQSRAQVFEPTLAWIRARAERTPAPD